MNDIIERMRSEKQISEPDSDFPRLCKEDVPDNTIIAGVPAKTVRKIKATNL